MKTNEVMTQATELFQKNIDNSIKWFHTANAMCLETQNKQMKLAKDIYDNAIKSLQQETKSDVYEACNTTGKLMMEAFQKNIEVFSNMTATALKTWAGMTNHV